MLFNEVIRMCFVPYILVDGLVRPGYRKHRTVRFQILLWILIMWHFFIIMFQVRSYSLKEGKILVHSCLFIDLVQNNASYVSAGVGLFVTVLPFITH